MRFSTLNYGLACLLALLCMHSNALPVITNDTYECSTLLAQEPVVVRQAYNQAVKKGNVTSGHRCLLKTVEQVEDIGALLNGIPENTVVFIVQKQADGGRPSFTFTIDLGNKPDASSGSDPLYNLYSRDHRRSITFNPVRRSTGLQPTPSTARAAVTASIRVDQLPPSTRCVPSKTAAHLKKGTVLLGVNEALGGGSIPICEAEKPERIWLMFEVGHNDQFEDMGKLYVSGFNFFPLLDNNPNPVDSVWRIRCYTGSIHFENNYFRLDTRASVYLQCTQNTEERVYFEFNNNTIVGMGSAQSQEGLLVDLRHLESQHEVAILSNNWFSGNIKSAVEVRLDSGSLVNIENNHIRPALSEFRQVQNALELHGPNETTDIPTINLNSNYLQSESVALKLYGKVNVSASGNQISTKELLQTPDRTDEGFFSIPEITLSSPQINYWYSSALTLECPSIECQSYLNGQFNLVVKPGNKSCPFDFQQ